MGNEWGQAKYRFTARRALRCAGDRLREILPRVRSLGNSAGATLGCLQTITAPLAGATTQFAYDGFGRMQAITASDGATTRFGYDAGDRLSQITYPDGTFEQMLYDRLDLAWRSDRGGYWTHYLYDALRHLGAVEDPRGQVTKLEWCQCGRGKRGTGRIGRKK